MSYRGRSKGNYGSQPSRRFSRRDVRLARAAFQSRSPISQGLDLAKQAPVTSDLEIWLRSPATLDFPRVDVKLSANPVERRKQAEDLVQVAAGKKLEVEVREPKRKKPIKRFRILKKEDAEKLKKEPEQSKTETPEVKESTSKTEENREETPKRRMPSKAEILQRAKEMFMEQQARTGLPAIAPEESELKETGLFDLARADLMRGEDTKADPQILQYISNLAAELEGMGFSIVPIGGN